MNEPLSTPRTTHDIDKDAGGQLATEWILVTAVVVIPIILFIPTMLEMINSYFNRVAGFIVLPFP